MNVFEFRNQLIENYATYTHSFIQMSETLESRSTANVFSQRLLACTGCPRIATR